MRLTDLRDSRIKSTDGETLGRVHEVHVEGGRIVALTCGPGSLVERLTATTHGKRIAWECVTRIGKSEITIGPEPAKPRPSASRSRRGTRRPSAPRSKR